MLPTPSATSSHGDVSARAVSTHASTGAVTTNTDASTYRAQLHTDLRDADGKCTKRAEQDGTPLREEAGTVRLLIYSIVWKNKNPI